MFNMFKKVSNVTTQNNMKEELISVLDKTIYDITRKNFGSDSDNEQIQKTMKSLKDARNRLDDSVGMADSDISNGVKKVKKDIDAVKNEAKGSFIGRIQDAVDVLIIDIDEIVDLQEGLINSIDPDESNEVKISNKLQKGYDEIISLESVLNKNRSRIEKDIVGFERDKKELDSKLLKETNSRIAKSLFNEIKAMSNNIKLLTEKSSYYASCFELIDTIKVYVNELISTASLSLVNVDKIKFITRIKDLRNVVDNPKELKQVLILIKQDMDESRSKGKYIETALNDTFSISEEDMSQVNEYRNSLMAENQNDSYVDTTMDELELYKKQLEKENN